MSLKKHIPKKIKVNIRLFKRILNDYNVKFSKKRNEKIKLNQKIQTIQEIKRGSYFENKVHNFHFVSSQISNIIIYPNEVFSFWKIIGNPNNTKNFKVGRNLVGGKISEEVAGGICQISSIMYHTALKTDLEIVERHNHSVDIYAENERFTPLGADATIVYPYKDLRIKNNYEFPISFSLNIKEDEVVCTLHSESHIQENNLDFVRDYFPNTICVSTIKNGKTINKSIYKKIRVL
jgi:vancomycin resistance protein VanW